MTGSTAKGASALRYWTLRGPADNTRSATTGYQTLDHTPQSGGDRCSSRRPLDLEEACERYNLTVDEFLSWQHLMDRHGLLGLRATQVQDYRE